MTEVADRAHIPLVGYAVCFTGTPFVGAPHENLVSEQLVCSLASIIARVYTVCIDRRHLVCIKNKFVTENGSRADKRRNGGDGGSLDADCEWDGRMPRETVSSAIKYLSNLGFREEKGEGGKIDSASPVPDVVHHREQSPDKSKKADMLDGIVGSVCKELSQRASILCIPKLWDARSASFFQLRKEEWTVGNR